jgi:5'-nucleotidase / UDP-sugar diphosphatase
MSPPRLRSPWSVAVWLPLLLALTAPAAARTADLVLLHLNDTHGSLEPLESEDGTSQGGIARLATLVSRIREQEGDRVLLLHAGDMLSRGDLSTVHYGGEVNIRAMNLVGYDALTPGNGEFYFGFDNLRQHTALAQFPVLYANLVMRETEERPFEPYTIRDVGDIKVGIIGLGMIRENHPSAAPLILHDPVETARELVQELRPRVDLLVALTHIGVSQDSVLARQVPEFDIIIGGHSHTRLDTPRRIPRTHGNGDVVIAQAWDRGRFVGRLDVQMEQDGERYRVNKVDGALLPVDDRLVADDKISRLLQEYAAPLGKVIASLEYSLPHPEEGHSAMGALATEALRTTASAELALLDRGALRSDLGAGQVTVADILRVHPWRNRVLRMVLTSGQIRATLTEGDLLTAGCSFHRGAEMIEGLRVGDQPAVAGRTYAVAIGEYAMWHAPSLRGLPYADTGERVDTALAAYLAQSELTPVGR